MCCIYKSYNRYVIFNRVILLCVYLFIPLVMFLEEQKFLILMKSIFLFYSLWFLVIAKKGFSGNSAGKESARDGGERPQFDFWVGKMRWRRGRLPTPVFLGFPVARLVKNPSAVLDPWVGRSHGVVPWRRAWQPTPVFLPGESPGMEGPGGLQSMGSQSVRHD